jgi:filamentous hemagglutinin family protein
MLANDKSRFFRRCITGSSALALATALTATPARAQTAFNAPDPTVASGTVNFNRGQTPGVDIYNVQTPTAVLDFTPSDQTGTGVINFQNAGTTAVYQGSGAFTVLNRIVPTDPSRAIQFNGTVRSLINSAPGGAVWFYSPGGIIAGGTALFDVGSLLLSTGDPTQGTGTIGSTTSFSLSSASNAGVTIQPGAQIMASPEGSYVALVAPVVNQNGAVRVNGSAAYVAAEQATLSINQGLFDISVTVGSDGGGTPLVHNGTTTGPASTGGGDLQGIFMVAVPKNSAITMLIAPNGQLGFDVAGGATVENGAIYLQAGGNLSVDTGETIVNRIAELPQGSLGASIEIGSGDFTSPIAAQARTDLLLTAGASPGISLAGDSYLYGGNSARITAGTNGVFSSANRLILNSFGAVPGTAQIDALAGSTMTFASLEVRADTLSGRFFNSAFDPSVGGTAALRSTGGAITINSSADVTAIGVGTGANSTMGGNADISASAGGTIAATGVFIDVSASNSGASATATGGQGTVFTDNGTIALSSFLEIQAIGSGTQGASARGGSANVITGAGGGTIQASTINLSAHGIGGSFSNGPAGAGTGGHVLVQTQDTGATASITTVSALLSAPGQAGDVSDVSAAGGAATGGLGQVLIGANGAFNVTGQTFIDVSSEAGSGSVGGAGGVATAGNIQFSATGGTITAHALDFSTSAAGGDGGEGLDAATPGGAGGGVLAGAGVSIFASGGGAISATSVSLDSSAFGGRGGDGADAVGPAGSGGSATASVSGIGISGSGQITLDSVDITANAFGGGTGSGAAQPGGAGGAAKSGDAFVFAGGGTIQLGAATMNSNATGGLGAADGSSGGDATGATASIGADTGGTVRILGGSLFVSAGGQGGSTNGAATGPGAGGKGVGGTAVIFANGGSTVDSAATFVDLEAYGSGGSAAGSGNGGLGQGGSARVNAGGGTIMLASNLSASADGSGGSASGTGNGGAGIGGEARLGTFSGSAASNVTVMGDVELDASGSGGFAVAGRGGDGLGGTPADLTNGPFDKGVYLVGIGGTVSVGGGVEMDASGSGGNGDAGGGAGTGGLTNLVVFGADIDAPGFVSLDSSGSGGSAFGGSGGAGGAGGTGTGGTSVISANSGGDSQGGGIVPTGQPGSITLGTLFQAVSGTGGDGGTGLAGGPGGVGGAGLGGVTNLVAQAGSGTLVTGDVTMDISGFGGDGGAGGAGGNGGRGGDGTGGFTNFGTVSGPPTTNNDGSATMGNVQVTVLGGGGAGGDGTGGGNGGAGGIGTGGAATLLSRGAPVVTQTVSLLGFATGGNGGAGATGGAGGNAVGGSVGLLATNRFQRTERGSYQGTDFSASVFIQPGTGSTMGASTGGQVSAQVTQADVALDSLNLFSFGIEPPAPGQESSLLVDGGTLTVGSSLSVSATGDLRFGAVNGGVLDATNLQLMASGSLLPPLSGTPGTIDLAGGFFAQFGGDFVTTSNFTTDSFFQLNVGGQLQVGDVTATGSVTLSSDNSSVTAGNIVASDSISLSGQTGVSAGNLSAESGYGTVSLQSGAGDIAAGDIRAANNLAAFASGDIALGDVTAGFGDPQQVFGGVEIGASGGVDVGDIQAPLVDIFTDEGAVAPFGGIRTGSIKSESISIDGLGNVSTGSLQTGDFYAGIDVGSDYLIGVATDGAVNVGAIDTPTSVGLASRNSSVTAGGIAVGDSVLILANTNIATGGIAGGTGPGNNVFLSHIAVLETDPVFEGFQNLDDFSFFDPSTLGNATPVRLSGSLTIGGPVTTGGFAAAASQGFNTQSIVAANRLLLDSGASLTLGDLSTDQALSLTSGGSLSVGNVQASTVDLTADGNVAAGGIQASGAVNVSAGNLASFSGVVGGSEITVTSADLQLGASARLGSAATTRLALNATNEGTLTFGGNGADGGYSISAAEAQGLRAQRIDISTEGPVRIGAVTLNGSGAGSNANLVGEAGQFSIVAAGDIGVSGAFTVANAGTGNRVTLRSGGRIAVATDSGGMIALTGSGAGSLGGTLELIGDSIAVATGSLLDQLAENPNFSGRNQALATPPSGQANLAGNIQANRLELTATQLIAIQNSGSAEQAAGFSAGAGGMRITSNAPSNAPLDLFAFGRVADSGGMFKINQETLSAVTFSTGEGSAGFSSGSAINNCVVGGSGCAAPPPPVPDTPPPAVIAPISTGVVDAVRGSLDSATDPESVAALPTVTLITTIDTGQLRTDPVISDPVSGGGNSSLWDAPEQQNDQTDEEPKASQGGDK